MCTEVSFLYIIILGCMGVKLREENFINLLYYSKSQTVSSQFSKYGVLMGKTFVVASPGHNTGWG